MLHTSKLRSGSRNGFILTLKRLTAALTLAILLPLAASGYTVVLRSGRQVEIPASFSLTRAGITYEYAPGLYVTIQMTSIDISATERANNEVAGSLLRRAEIRKSAVSEKPAASSSAASRESRRTLTDKDLEASRERRRASESLYERRRVELGLPTVEESRRQREEDARRLRELQSSADANEAQSESYWRARAEDLRTEIAVTDAEINYLRSQLSQTSSYLPTVAFTNVTPFPFVSSSFGRMPERRFSNYPLNIPGPRRTFPVRSPLYGRAGFGGPARGQILVNGGSLYTGFRGRRVFTTTGVAIFPFSAYAPYSYNYNYDQSGLLSRLRELEAERVGLQARWRLLEDEARRAGAPPGWLRP